MPYLIRGPSSTARTQPPVHFMDVSDILASHVSKQ